MAKPKQLVKQRKHEPIEDKIIPRSQAFRDVIGCGSSKGLRLQNDPSFPRPVIIGGSPLYPRYGFRMSQLQDWIARLPEVPLHRGKK